MKKTSKKFVEIKHGRTGKQVAAMKRIEERGECPFCFKNLQKEHKKPILYMGNHWFLTESQFPYEEAKMHFLLISSKHSEKLSDIHDEAGKEFFNIIKWVEKEYDIQSGGVAMRFGDVEQNGASVRHLHAHVLIPYKISDPKFQVLRFRISGKK